MSDARATLGKGFGIVWGAAVACGFFAGCYDSPSPANGWGLSPLPATPPAYDQVFQAAKSVVQERYPMSAVSEEAGFIVALTPVRMDGGSKTRKEISVLVRRNFTGAYDPVVRVRQFVEIGSPTLSANPETANAAWAAPLAGNEWHAVDYLPYEEQALYDAILQRVAAPAPSGSGGDRA